MLPSFFVPTPSLFLKVGTSKNRLPYLFMLLIVFSFEEPSSSLFFSSCSSPGSRGPLPSKCPAFASVSPVLSPRLPLDRKEGREGRKERIRNPYTPAGGLQIRPNGGYRCQADISWPHVNSIFLARDAALIFLNSLSSFLSYGLFCFYRQDIPIIAHHIVSYYV